MTRKPAPQAGKSEYYHVSDGEWIEIPMRNHMDQCCDCGLIHRLNFRINTKGRLEVQAFRDAAPQMVRDATLRLRRRTR